MLAGRWPRASSVSQQRLWRGAALTWREARTVAAIALCPRGRARCLDAGEARFVEETLLIEWPKGEAAPTKFWLATVDRNMSFRGLVDLVKLRWRIERDYHDLK